MSKLKHLPNFLIALGLLSINNSFAEQVHVFRIGRGDSTLEYRISLPKDTFFLHERTYVRVWGKNVSPVPLKCRYLYTDWKITDTNGKSFHPTKIYDAPVYAPVIKPGDSVGGTTDFQDYGIWDTLNFTIPRFLPEGKYSALHPLDTLLFTFTITKPVGEEVEVLKNYLEAYSPTSKENMIRFSKPQERDSILKEQARRLFSANERFPMSIYARQTLLESHRQADTVLRHKIIQKILEYPLDKKEQMLSDLSNPFSHATLELQQKIILDLIEKCQQCALSFRPDLFDILKRSFYYQKDYWNELERIIKTSKDEKLVAAAKEALRKDKE